MEYKKLFLQPETLVKTYLVCARHQSNVYFSRNFFLACSNRSFSKISSFFGSNNLRYWEEEIQLQKREKCWGGKTFSCFRLIPNVLINIYIFSSIVTNRSFYKLAPVFPLSLNPLIPNISMYILHAALQTFSTVMMRRICYTIKTSVTCWSLPFFSEPLFEWAVLP